jgi:hypothetical protein
MPTTTILVIRRTAMACLRYDKIVIWMGFRAGVKAHMGEISVKHTVDTR